MSSQMVFTRFPVTTGISLAYLLTNDSQRRGIYVLTFTDGTEYVGQAADVLTRFRSHARHFADDIVSIDFAPVPRPSLDTLELLTIRWRLEEGARLRNRLFIGPPTNGRSMEHWLPHSYPVSFRTVAASIERDVRVAYGRPTLDGTSLRNFARLMEHPAAEMVIDALAAFLHHSVSFPAHTEQQVWVMTAVPRHDDGRRRLACLTVQNMQLLTLFVTAPGETYAAINLAPSPRIDARYNAEDSDYQFVNGVMQHAFLRPEGVVEALNEDPGFRSAARNAASSLIGKGPSLIRRYHCRPLADAVYASMARSAQGSHNSRLPR